MSTLEEYVAEYKLDIKGWLAAIVKKAGRLGLDSAMIEGSAFS